MQLKKRECKRNALTFDENVALRKQINDCLIAKEYATEMCFEGKTDENHETFIRYRTNDRDECDKIIVDILAEKNKNATEAPVYPWQFLRR